MRNSEKIKKKKISVEWKFVIAQIILCLINVCCLYFPIKLIILAIQLILLLAQSIYFAKKHNLS